MQEGKREYRIKIVLIFVFGFVGIVSALPLIPKLISATGQEPPLPMPVIQAISTLQSSLLLLAMVLLGAWASSRVELGTPILDTYLKGAWDKLEFKKYLVPAVLGGTLGGILLLLFYHLSIPYLPQGFVENGRQFDPPFYTKILYGGITEEVLVRWGFMSFLVWIIFRVTQRSGSKIRNHNYIIAILLSALVFGAGHLPAAKMLTPVFTGWLAAYIIIGNSIFGVIAGCLYWKRGLETAVLSHMFAHVVMIAGGQFA